MARRAGIFALGTIAAALITVGSAAAAVDGVYANWTVTVGTPSTGTATVAATGFPTATFTTTSMAPSVPSGASAYLNSSTPIGAEYGSSQNRPYVSLRTADSLAPSVTTATFSSPTPSTGWGFAFGDVDAEMVTIAATGPDGALTAAELGWQGAFNYCTGSPLPSSCAGMATDTPTWSAGTRTLTGSGSDTSGAAGWFTPTVPVTTLTLTITRLSGSPALQMWLVGSAVEPTPTPTPTTTDSTTPTSTSTSSASSPPTASAGGPTSPRPQSSSTSGTDPAASGGGGVLANSGAQVVDLAVVALLLIVSGVALRRVTRTR